MKFDVNPLTINLNEQKSYHPDEISIHFHEITYHHSHYNDLTKREIIFLKEDIEEKNTDNCKYGTILQIKESILIIAENKFKLNENKVIENKTNYVIHPLNNIKKITFKDYCEFKDKKDEE